VPTFTYCPLCTAPLRDAIVDGEKRRACVKDPCTFVYYDNPTPVVAAIVEYAGCVVLARNRAWRSDFYGLITGFLERDETPEQGVMREVKEELGLDAHGATLVGVYAFERMNQVIIAYHVPASGQIVLNYELVDYKCVQPEDCRVWAAGTGDALRDWLRTKGYEPALLQPVR
jgi:NAD+ diphosphatase